jgi:hypothetical protein
MQVTVVGTEFDLSWIPKSGAFAVKVSEGRVRVVGPGTEVRVVDAGQALELSREDILREQGAVGTDEASEILELEDLPEDTTDALPSSPRVVNADWSRLLARGKFRQIVTEAEKAGIDSVLADANSAKLKALAQASNYSGRSDLSLRTWTVIRKRFAGTPAAVQASFFVGRIHDQRGNGVTALEWFDTYLAEAGHGSYAAEALGRKLVLVRRLRGKAEARGVARQYLERFPKGMYAPTAEGLLSE